jgi:drug/metabolite transporter (DMT)-like permease
VAWALLLIGERPDRFGIAGGSLVVAGVLIIVGAARTPSQRGGIPASDKASPTL